MDVQNAANGHGNGEGAGDPPVLPDLAERKTQKKTNKPTNKNKMEHAADVCAYLAPMLRRSCASEDLNVEH